MSLSASGSNLKITSSATYDDYGNFLTKTVNELGKTTTYNYDNVTKLLAYVQNANNVHTAYVYDNRDRTTKVYLDSDKDGVPDTAEAQVAYLYANNRLSGIDTATTDYTLTYDAFGNVLTIKAGNYVLATYEYAPNNGKLKKLTYGNGDYEEYIYDILDRLVEVKLNGVTEYVVKYDSNGRLYSLTESGTTHIYEYDSLDRLIRAWQENASGKVIISVENSYDDLGRISGSKYGDVSTTAQQYSITYKEDCNLVDTYTMPGNKVNTYTYDEFERLSQKTHSNNAYTSQYSYLTDSDGNTSSLVSRMDIDTSTTNTYYTYTYNNLGYISSISKNGSVIASYTYDALGQLTTEVNRETNRVYNYSYDKSGNILGKTVYNNSTAEVIERFTYTYGDTTWGDMLTNYNGTSISYDAIGNPTKWRNATNMSWNGRELQGVTLSNTKYMTFDYDSSGVRTRKTYVETNGNTWDYSYVLDGSKIIKETLRAYTTGSPAAGLTITLIYSYDDSGVAAVSYNGTRYYYVKNLQGDVIGLVNSSGNYVVKYSYDAWGNIVSTTGSMASSLGDYNPFRYRSYYYDVETGFYYLQSRYYDPTVGRFLNADGIIGANGGIEGYNMFAYCNNNPVMYSDPSGCSITSCFEAFWEFFIKLNTACNYIGQFTEMGVGARDAILMSLDIAKLRLSGNDQTILYAYESGVPDMVAYSSGDSVDISYDATIFVIQGSSISSSHTASTFPQFPASKEFSNKGCVAILAEGMYKFDFTAEYDESHKNVYHIKSYSTSSVNVSCVRWDKSQKAFCESTADGILIHKGGRTSSYNNPASMGCLLVQGDWYAFVGAVGKVSGTLFVYRPNFDDGLS